MNKPFLFFSLLGRKSSGKSCLFTALCSPRVTNKNNITCTIQTNEDRLNEIKKELIALCPKKTNKEDEISPKKAKEENREKPVSANKSFFSFEYEKLIDNSDKIKKCSKELLLRKKDNQARKLPNATALGERATYVFSFENERKQNVDLALFDYAGELLDKSGSVKNDFNVLLGHVDAIFAVLGCPKNKEEEETFSQEIEELRVAFNSVNNKMASPVVLLITKFDRFIKKNHLDFNKPEEYNKNFKEDSLYKKLGDLIHTLENKTNEGMFNIYFTSSFGECDENDLPIKDQLEPIDLLEPFDFAIEKVLENKKNDLNEIKEEIKKSSLLGYLNSSLIGRLIDYNKNYEKYLKQLNKLERIFPEDKKSDEYKKIEEAKQDLKNKISAINRYLFVFILALFIFADCYFDYKYIQGLSLNPETVYECDKRIRELSDYKEAGFYRHALARLFLLSNKEVDKKLESLKKKKDDKEYANLLNMTNLQEKVTFANSMLYVNPDRSDAENIKLERDKAQKELDKINKEKQERDWNESLNRLKSTLGTYEQKQTEVNEKEYKKLQADVVKLKNDYGKLFAVNQDSEKELDSLESKIHELYINTQRNEWHASLNSLKTELDVSEQNQTEVKEEDHKKLQDKVLVLRNNRVTLFPEKTDLEEKLDLLKTKIDELYINTQTKDWRKRASELEINISNADSLKKLTTAYKPELDDLIIIASNNKAFNLEADKNKLEEKYNAKESELFLKEITNTYNEKIKDANSYSATGEVEELKKTFQALIELKQELDNSNLKAYSNELTKFNENFKRDTNNIVDKCLNNVKGLIESQKKNEEYDVASTTLNIIFYDNHLKALAEIINYNLDDDYKKIYDDIEFAKFKSEFEKEYIELSEIRNQNYREMFDTNYSKNLSKLNNFIMKFKSQKRNEYSNYIKDVEKLRDYVRAKKATLNIQIVSYTYPNTFNLQGSDKTMIIDNLNNNKDFEIYHNDGGLKRVVQFSFNMNKLLSVEVRSEGIYDNIGTRNTKLTYSGDGTFDDAGICDITLNFDSGYRENFNYKFWKEPESTKITKDKTFDGASGSISLKILGLANVPELTPIEYK